MLKVVTAEEMRQIDRKTIEDYGVSGIVLMEKAGLSVAKRIKWLFKKQKVVVLSGGGNNGGDGMVAARKLHNEGWPVKAFLFAEVKGLNGEALESFKKAKRAGVCIEINKELSEKDIANSIIVDALLGTGLNKNVRPPVSEVINKTNKSSSPVISIDIPSGISSDTGQVMGCAVRADFTVTFGLPKRGHFLYPGAGHTGKLFIEGIGFPENLINSEKLKVELIEKKDMSMLLPKRPKYSHKGDYGHVLVVAGSKGKTGAALMTAKACLRAGAGLVTIGVPESLMDVFQSRVTEEMTLPLPDAGDGTLSSKAIGKILEFLSGEIDVLAIGPGISTGREISKIVDSLITKSTVPVIIDADALNALKKDRNILRRAKAPLILTPHPGEMSRITGKAVKDIEADRINSAIEFSKEAKTYLVLKGVPTITADPDGRAFINSTGNPGMATAGAGDVLTGILAGLLAQKMRVIDAVRLGVYIHGLAGDIAAEKKTETAMIAGDIIEMIPDALRNLGDLN